MKAKGNKNNVKIQQFKNKHKRQQEKKNNKNKNNKNVDKKEISKKKETVKKDNIIEKEKKDKIEDKFKVKEEKEEDKKVEIKNKDNEIKEEKGKIIKEESENKDNNNKIETNQEETSDKTRKIIKSNVQQENIFLTRKIYPRGLNNIGATCYMNSVLQCFYHIYDLSNELLKLEKIDEKIMPMTSAFLEVIKLLTWSQHGSISPYKFKDIISNNEIFEGMAANDSKALTLYFLDTVNEEFNDNNISIENQSLFNAIRTLKEKEAEKVVRFFNSQYNSIIGDLFNGLKTTKFKCLKCGDIFIDYQIINIYNLTVEQTYNGLLKNKKIKGKTVDIIDCFKNEEKTKLFNGDNKIFCDKCNKQQDGEITNKIYMTPKVMILFLDRGKNNRFHCEVTFPEELSLNSFVEKSNKEAFQLIGSIEHLGSSGMGGHFIANCRHFDGKYYVFSDSSVYGPMDNYKQNGIPYLLFYRKID